jgi:hypothetical protein
VDLMTSQLMWSVYLPNDYAYLHFASTLEKEELIRGLNLLAVAPREYDEKEMRRARSSSTGASDVDVADRLQSAYKGNASSSEFRNLPLGEEEVNRQMQAEVEFSSRLESLAQEPQSAIEMPGLVSRTGVLPIQIRIPTGGQVYRFARTIIREDDPLTMSVTYSAGWMIGLMKWVLLALAVLILFLCRRMLGRAARGIGARVRALCDAVGRQEGAIKGIAQSIVAPIVLLGLVILFWSISGPLTAFFFFFLWVSLVYQLVLWRRRRNGVRSRVPVEPAGGDSERRP